MKGIYLLVVMLSFAAITRSQNALHTVNAVIGDKSFLQIFNKLPDHSTAETLRLQTHLMFVEQMLRNKTTKNLTKRQKLKREKILDLLHNYWVKGVFPNNYDFPGERKPCFIDRDGKICAVGYLVEKTAGIEVAKKINARHQYAYITEMNEDIVIAWAKENGLTLEECALIQPAYGGVPTDKTEEVSIKTSYGISSGIIGGSNIALSILNLNNQNKHYSKTASTIGLLSGTTQLVLGLTNIRKDKIDYGINGYNTKISYKAQNNLSYINIASGAATIITSSLNLLINKNKKEVKNNISFYSAPGINSEMNLGMALSRKL